MPPRARTTLRSEGSAGDIARAGGRDGDAVGDSDERDVPFGLHPEGILVGLVGLRLEAADVRVEAERGLQMGSDRGRKTN